jgi:hypothetical protein
MLRQTPELCPERMAAASRGGMAAYLGKENNAVLSLKIGVSMRTGFLLVVLIIPFLSTKEGRKSEVSSV